MVVSLTNDPGLSAQLDVLPPKELTVDGMLRRRNRDIPPEEAVRLAARGLRSFVLAWQFATEVATEELAHVLARYAADFDGMGRATHPRRRPTSTAAGIRRRTRTPGSSSPASAPSHSEMRSGSAVQAGSRRPSATRSNPARTIGDQRARSGSRR